MSSRRALPSLGGAAGTAAEVGPRRQVGNPGGAFSAGTTGFTRKSADEGTRRSRRWRSAASRSHRGGRLRRVTPRGGVDCTGE